MLYEPIIVEKEVFGKKVTIETGRMAKQASGAVITTCGGTSVLTTVCYRQSDDDANRDFFPLTVNYVEKYYAAGKYPGGFIKREGRVSNRETLIARLTDRPLRPLFPKAFKSEVQIISTVISYDGINTGDILSMIGSSAALSISEVPFAGPVGAVKIGQIDGEFIINASNEDFEKSDFEIIVAGTADAIMMVEGVANIVPEETLINALEEAHKYIKLLVEVQTELVEKCGKPKLEVIEEKIPEEFVKEVEGMLHDNLEKALFVQGKMNRSGACKNAVVQVREALAERISADPKLGKYIWEITDNLSSSILRKAILEKGIRCDNRNLTEVRPIQIETSVLDRTHGSALFTRGETQSLGIVTLGTNSDMQSFDSIEGNGSERFMLHYNFPPYSVGEAKRVGPPGRREVGHGNLAQRSLNAVIPSFEEFPYAIRVVSEILESNGSSSQASVCAGCLSLMDAGVPLKAPVAGIAMGLIKEGDNFKILTDILGTEDHLGDMDFKIAGTEEGVTAIQMDIKIKGLTFEIMRAAIAQAHDGRLHILNEMKKALDAPRENLSAYAPKIIKVDVAKDRIKDLIGPGGKNIKSIVERTSVKVDVTDNGTVTVAGIDQEKIDLALLLIKGFTKNVSVGEIYEGRVVKVENFGAFVEILPGTDGLLHVSELADGFVKNTADFIKIDEKIKVKIIGIDRQGRISLSKKQV